MKILFVYQKYLSFVAKDLEILRSKYEVQEFQFNNILKVVGLWQAVRRNDLVFCWFGKLHAFFAVISSLVSKKKIIIVAGGDDVADVPEIPYGLMAHPLKRWFAIFTFRLADMVLPFSEHSRLEVIKNTGADQGITERVYLGFDHNVIFPERVINKENMVLTVGSIRRENLKRKGLELFVKSASLLPSSKFVVIGEWLDSSIKYLKGIASSNVAFAGEVSDSELLRYFHLSRVYVQASLHEGFGSSLAEAMLCECIPVVSRKGSLHEVVGDCGIYVEEQNPEAVAEKIREALAASPELGKRARQRIVEKFPLEKRKRELLAAIEDVLRDASSILVQ